MLTQTQYTSKIIEWLSMTASKECLTSMKACLKLTAVDGEQCREQYRVVISALMYLMVSTRPDSAYAVCALVEHVKNPLFGYWKAVYRMLRYLTNTRHLELCYGGYNLQTAHMFTPVQIGRVIMRRANRETDAL